MAARRDSERDAEDYVEFARVGGSETTDLHKMMNLRAYSESGSPVNEPNGFMSLRRLCWSSAF